MVRFLVNRPVSVMMAFAAFFILGIITYLNIPVSLLPDIAIPEITVQVSGKNTSARELENTVVSSIRQQLLQIGKLRDIRSETRDGSAIIRLSFDYGVNTDLAFIEVNEKIDAAMNYIPRDIDRPRVIKASATDIPVFNLNMTLKNDSGEDDIQSFLNLSELAENVIRRRIEQLPEVAMVDMTGLVNKQVVITPDENILRITGITLSDIETVLQNNNIEPGSMIIRDGYYEYNIKFSAVMRNIEDIENLFIRKDDRILQLKDIAHVKLLPEPEEGLSYFNGKRSVCLSVIKQSEENMSNMQESIARQVEYFRNDYPAIAFDISQNQTELLDYTISNLQQNLILAFIFVCLVSAIFLRDVRSPLVIGLSMFISLIISLLFFYLCNISLNIISLTGLILALGMMIDNSIIVTDNIGQYRKQGLKLDEACISGTNEVIGPMLSSALTTISVFVPLVFLSGIAGAIFFDQAFSVAVGLMVSYFTGIILLPVLYKVVFAIRKKGEVLSKKETKKEETVESLSLADRLYDKGIDWVFSHKILVTIIMIAVFPVCFFLFTIIPKDKLPDISQNELMVKIEWNENIHAAESADRINIFNKNIREKIVESSVLIGQQQFLLNREQELTSSEAEIYLKLPHTDDIPFIKKWIGDYFTEKYPAAIFSFSPAATVFEKIFVTGAPELTLELYTKNTEEKPEPERLRTLENKLKDITGEELSGIAFQNQLSVRIDREKLLLYNVSYNEVYQLLKTGLKGNEFSILRSYQQYLPIVMGGEEKTVSELIDNALIYVRDDQGKRFPVPLRTFVSVFPSEDIKNIVSGRNGEYIPVDFYHTDHPGNIIKTIKKEMKNDSFWDVDFSGEFFSNRQMLNELLIILLISLLMMYFILAAQFESFIQPFLVLLEIPIDVAAALGLLYILGHTLNLMSAIGIIVTCGIIINDSILKLAMINQLRKEGIPLLEAIHTAGRRRLKAILMTSFTTIVCMAPLLLSHDMGSELEKPLAIATIGGMVIGTLVSLFVLPLAYWAIYRDKR